MVNSKLFLNNNFLSKKSNLRVWGAPAGFDARLLAELVDEKGDLIFIARDDVRLARTAECLAFFAPEIRQLDFPAWDCLPYDRVSPNVEIVSRRIHTLVRLLENRQDDEFRQSSGRIVLTTVSAILQRVPPRYIFENASRDISVGSQIDPAELTAFIVRHGYNRSETVMEPGEFAVRGGIIDVFPTGTSSPVRLDFFGDELESIRPFDATSQRSAGRLESLSILPVSEVPLNDQTITLFRTGYRKLFGVPKPEDTVFESISAGRREMGYEHWLPLFFEKLESLLDYLPNAPVILDYECEESLTARQELIQDYYEARLNVGKAGSATTELTYNPVLPHSMFLNSDDWNSSLSDRAVGAFSPFAGPSTEESPDAGGRPGRDFRDARIQPGSTVFDTLKDYILAQRREGRRVLITAFSRGSRDRLETLITDHGVGEIQKVENWDEIKEVPPHFIVMTVLGIEQGFRCPDLAVISEPDILGERISRTAQKRRAKPEDIISDAGTLGDGDLVVHSNHGIGRYDGLTTLEVGTAPHDCLRIIYHGDDKLFVPVENIEMLSRYGANPGNVQLDRLGGAAWQARKARLKQRVRDMAGELISVAAKRQLKPAPRFSPPDGLFDEFCSRFPFSETEDQNRAIQDAIDDLTRGIPADRLVCGDVGFGKTEVALRAAFVAVMSGKQVGIVVPTTLLCRQHFQTFSERFADYPVRIEQLSRLVPAGHAKQVRSDLTAGNVDIVIGTHALLSKSIEFHDLGLLVVDEEQHFGVAHKERLKKMKSDVHVLTLTATPIPRTLQLALTGVRELSIIATPPVDRLAVRTFVLPFDPVVIREAIMREHFRGGQTFYVCPRIEDLSGVVERLAKLVPEVRIAVAHGQMASSELESRISAFYQKQIDVLLSTNIIESGLDLPAVNTIIIHRADRFGLAQLYQLRGRVGRSKVRAYAYLTLPERQRISASAQKRLEVMQTLDSLGAGFSLASHDLDIRGAGNLLGEEQSGHIREVGVELYQQMLEEAVAEAKGRPESTSSGEEWSPQVNFGMAVLIPETYVSDLGVRLNLYRRIAKITDAREVDGFAAELIDRFGTLPTEVENLLQTISIKCLCRRAGVEKVEAGPKGAVLSFHNLEFSNPAGLVEFITKQLGTAKLRPDHKLVFIRSWDRPEQRLIGLNRLLIDLSVISESNN